MANARQRATAQATTAPVTAPVTNATTESKTVQFEANKPIVVSPEERQIRKSELSEAGFNAVESGLGLPEGKYFFTTADGNFLGMLPIVTRKNDKLNLLFVYGKAEGDDEKTNGIVKTFEGARTCVIPASSWDNVQPNTSYTMVVNDRGYVSVFEEYVFVDEEA